MKRGEDNDNRAAQQAREFVAIEKRELHRASRPMRQASRPRYLLSDLRLCV